MEEEGKVIYVHYYLKFSKCIFDVTPEEEWWNQTRCFGNS